MAKKNEETKAPRMSQIERLQQQLAEAQAKAEAREQKKIDALSDQYAAAAIRLIKATAKLNAIRDQLYDLGVHQEDIDHIEEMVEDSMKADAEPEAE